MENPKSKKELKEEYKSMKFRMGVFQVRNLLNNKIYIDSSVNLDKIWNRHRLQLNFGNHPNVLLQHDWKQYGEDNFVYEILGEVEETENSNLDYAKEVKVLEQMYIEELKPFDERGYNKKT